MDFKNQGNGSGSSSSILFKKKRGRPRKDQSENPSRIANLLTMSAQIQAHGDYGYIPPGFAKVNGNPSHEGNAVHHSDDVMVGQTLQGVVEATFDTGYLLSVRIGNSETSLRGVVFKPGQFAPFSTDTDVAPHIQMISRKLVSFLSGNQTPVHASYRKARGRGRGKPRRDSHFMYSDNGLVTYSGKQLQVGPAQPDTLLCDRGTVVPVVLEPGNQSNCVAQPIKATLDVSQPAKNTPSVSQPAHLTASKARLVKRTQIDQLEKDLKTDNSPPSMEEACKIDGSAVKLPGVVMEELVNQVLRRIQSSTQPKVTRIESGQASGAFTYGYERMQDLNEPFLAEPPQAVYANHFNESPSFSRNFGCARPGKMTELLLAVQENVIDKQTAGVQHHVFSRQ